MGQAITPTLLGRDVHLDHVLPILQRPRVSNHLSAADLCPFIYRLIQPLFARSNEVWDRQIGICAR